MIYYLWGGAFIESLQHQHSSRYQGSIYVMRRDIGTASWRCVQWYKLVLLGFMLIVELHSTLPTNNLQHSMT
jgi:hypothetical protein